jgi:ribosomal protein S18 acetylase RimI-like enzyme
MIIRNFRLEDYDNVVELWRKAKLSIGESDSLEEIKKKLDRDEDLFLVAEDSGIVGVVIGAWDGRRAWVYHLAVSDERRNENIGTDLINELELRFKNKGAIKINLLVDRHNQQVQLFYEKQGFTTYDVIYLTKRL